MNDDLISRQAAIKALDGEIEITGRTNAEAVKGYVRLVRDRLERLPSAPPEDKCSECDAWNQYKNYGYSQWIPVSERMPEKNGRYLVTCEQWGAWEVDWDIWYTTPKPGWLWDHGVTAWMPLPEPWRGERWDER